MNSRSEHVESNLVVQCVADSAIFICHTHCIEIVYNKAKE